MHGLRERDLDAVLDPLVVGSWVGGSQGDQILEDHLVINQFFFVVGCIILGILRYTPSPPPKKNNIEIDIFTHEFGFVPCIVLF